MADHFKSIKTKIEVGILTREIFKNIMNDICEEHCGYPLDVHVKEEPVHGGMYSRFIVQIKGKPDEVEDLAVHLDSNVFMLQICTHERLHIN